ncbi:hypothetical protein HKT18_05000 [Flavobacterium sp. IMCC34852]|uniref:Uncharacterized protein n=1 Tax=Flavobacterium rivulicola TaxID=2732161 RepID=A0A7Y3R8N5_9FLAO|nr:DUF6527 family protein [Flavobacterium sp. IMCC34852]NNT71571.1 hypothetical protein [Flavobacterium sp. IMCC34852]
MKRILGFFKWLSKVSGYFTNKKPQNSRTDVDDSIGIDPSRFQIDVVDDIPELISDKTIFIVQDGNAPELLAFKCPCGCNADIVLNLLEDASPCWSYEIMDGNTIDIYPSIWRKAGCKSHFFVTNGKIRWV